jgi:5-methylcytosine-specific restriction endonuclease McrA
MEADEWLLQMIYMCEFGMKTGVSSQKALTEWVRRAQSPTGFASTGNTEFNSYRSRWNALVDWTVDMLKSVPRNDASKLTPMVAQVISLYGWEIEKNSDNQLKIKDKKKFTTSFFKVMYKWNDINVYGRHKQISGKDMQPFKDLFGGKNPNAMQTISWILNKERGIDESKIDTRGELLQGPLSDSARKFYDEWGIVEVDPRESFSSEDIFKKWKEQEEKCIYTGRDLDSTELVGDHYIPRSWGIKHGGVTEYDNLVVTDRIINSRKSGRHGDDFIKTLKGDA